MPCPCCGKNNRSVGFESGDTITCKHCFVHLMLVGRIGSLGGRWEYYDPDRVGD